MMKFIADENIPLEVIKKLKDKNFDIISISEKKRGLDDEEILSIANKDKRVLITFDTDFGEIIFKLKKQNNGVILLRIHPKSVEYIITVIEKVLSKDINFEKSFCVIEIDRIRVIPIIK